MRGIRYASLVLVATGSCWAAESRGAAASMDPYLPIRNSALQFDLGASYVSQSGIYAPKDTAK